MLGTVAFVFVLQGLGMLADEAVFHRRRGLPLWERVGHPVDTLSILACLLVAIFLPLAKVWLLSFGGLAVLSLVCITKDEWVHSRECSGGEQWLHAVLFILHPLVLVSAFLLWLGARSRLTLFGIAAGPSGMLLKGQAILTALFLVYQTVYWNWFKKSDSRDQ